MSYLDYEMTRVAPVKLPPKRRRTKTGDIVEGNPPKNYHRAQELADKHGIDRVDILRAASNGEIDFEYDDHGGKYVYANSRFHKWVRKLQPQKRYTKYELYCRWKMAIEDIRLVSADNTRLKWRNRSLERNYKRRVKINTEQRRLWMQRVYNAYVSLGTYVDVARVLGVRRQAVAKWVEEHNRNTR
jgi:hypothetical protein